MDRDDVRSNQRTPRRGAVAPAKLADRLHDDFGAPAGIALCPLLIRDKNSSVLGSWLAKRLLE
jgi:hypothetical protein